MSFQCPSCGPGGQGRCLGPDLCCGSLIGCFSHTRESHVCSREDVSPIPCSNSDLHACAAVNRGVCALNELCCNESGKEYTLPHSTSRFACQFPSFLRRVRERRGVQDGQSRLFGTALAVREQGGKFGVFRRVKSLAERGAVDAAHGADLGEAGKTGRGRHARGGWFERGGCAIWLQAAGKPFFPAA